MARGCHSIAAPHRVETFKFSCAPEFDANWSARRLAEEVGLSPATEHRPWRDP